MRKLVLLAALGLVLASASPATAKRPSKKQLKINVYVEMLNKWSPFMSKGWSTYTKWADPKAGPTCAERGIRGPGGLGTSAPKIFAGFKKALRKRPKLKADEAAMAMAAALEEIREPVTEASGYYHKRLYKKDDCARGKALHPTLMAAWSKYFTAEREVRAFVVAYNDERAVAQLTKTKKKYGKRNRYHYEKLILDGKSLIRIVDVQTSAKEPDAEAVQTALEVFMATQSKALEIVNKAKKRDASVLYQGGYKQMVNHYAKQYAASVERMLKTLAKRGEPRFNAKSLERDIKQCFGSYNRMIDAANKVRFSKKIK